MHVRLNRRSEESARTISELEEASKTKESNVWAKRKTADTEVVAERARTKRTEHNA